MRIWMKNLKERWSQREAKMARRSKRKRKKKLKNNKAQSRSKRR